MVKVAAVMSTFNRLCFKYECELREIDLENWEEELPAIEPELFLAESVWGHKYRKLAEQCRLQDSGKGNVFDWCKRKGIPTVFWNKEDPVSFKTFINIARKFEYIFTTDMDCIPKYTRATGRHNAFLLPFAAQPAIHNPVGRDGEKLGKVAFAGTWYSARRKERQDDMACLFDAALPYGLHIYDRMLVKSPKYEYPAKYRHCMQGTLGYMEMASAIKKYDVFLNVNTAKKSSTMLSRRVFEVLACGVCLVSAYSPSVEYFFPGIVQVCNGREEAGRLIRQLLEDRDLRDRISLSGQRKVFSEHTYGHRMQEILKTTGLTGHTGEPDGVTIAAYADDVDQLKNILDNFARQNYPHRELVLAYNSRNLDRDMVNAECKKANGGANGGANDGANGGINGCVNDGKIKVFETRERIGVKKCLALACDHSRYGYLSVFGGTSYYAPEYTRDIMNAFKYCGTEVAGKGTYFACNAPGKPIECISACREYHCGDALCTDAFIVKKEAFIKGTAGIPDEGTLWGVKAYSADRFNFVYNLSACDCPSREEYKVLVTV